MAAPFHNLLSKSDRAFAEYIIANVPTAADITCESKRSLDQDSLPLVVAYSESWKADPGNMARAIISSSITVKTPATLQPGETSPAKRITSETLQANVFDVFYLSVTDNDFTSVADAITAAARALAVSDPANNADLADFKCDEFQVVGGSLAADEAGNFWMDTLDIEMICRSSTGIET